MVEPCVLPADSFLLMRDGLLQLMIFSEQLLDVLHLTRDLSLPALIHSEHLLMIRLMQSFALISQEKLYGGFLIRQRGLKEISIHSGVEILFITGVGA